MTKPYRVPPADFVQSFILMGWSEIADHYRTNYRCVARWIRQAGDETLRWERCFVTGSRTKPNICSKRYADAAIPPLASDLRAVWWSKPKAKFRLTLADRTRQKLPSGSLERLVGHAALPPSDAAAAPNHREPPSASLDEIQRLLRLALQDGGVAVVGDRRLRVDAPTAERLAATHFDDAPVEGVRALLALLLTRGPVSIEGTH